MIDFTSVVPTSDNVSVNLEMLLESFIEEGRSSQKSTAIN